MKLADQLNPQRSKVLEEMMHAMFAVDLLIDSGARTKRFPMNVIVSGKEGQLLIEESKSLWEESFEVVEEESYEI